MPQFPSLSKPQGAEATDVALSWNMLGIRVALAPQRRPKSREDTQTRLVCPDKHDTPTRVNERYICPDGHAHTRGEMLSARELEDGTLVVVDKEAKVEAITGGQAEKELDLIAVPRADLERWTRYDDSGMRVRLVKKHSSQEAVLYRVFLALTENADTALVGTMVISGKRRMWALEQWNGQLFLQSLIETSNLAPPDDIELPSLDEATEAKVAKLAADLPKLAQPFDPARFAFDARTALDELAASVAESGTSPSPLVTAPAASVEGLLDALDALVAATPKAKPARAKKAVA